MYYWLPVGGDRNFKVPIIIDRENIGSPWVGIETV
jgi:hypothetical protein